MTLRVGLLAVTIGSTVLAACGGQSATSPTSSEPMTRPSASNAAPLPDHTSRVPDAGKEEMPATTDPEAITDLVGFTSPSGNVGCIIEPAMVRCDISERDWAPPPRPADCEFDYGQGIDLSAGQKPTFVCAGDTTLGAGDPLDYGKSISAGALRCDSTEAGITCRDSTTRHGFTIAREAFQFF